MGKKRYQDKDKVERTHPAADIKTIIFDPDDIIETMRRNRRDRNSRRHHILRATPPLKGDKRATLFLTESGNYYPPDMNPTPIHLSAESFVVGHSAGNRHPDWREHWSYPHRDAQRRRFRDEFDIRGERSGNRKLTDSEQQKWNEWWATATEEWEGFVRHALNSTDT